MILQRCATCLKDRSIKTTACPSCKSLDVSTYRAVVSVNGRRKTKSCKVLSDVVKAEMALKAEAELTRLRRRGRGTPSPSPVPNPTTTTTAPAAGATLNEIWDSYLANAKARGKKALKTDAQRYRDYIQPHIGAMVATDIKPVYIQNIVDECLTVKGLAPATAVKVFSLIRAMLNYADRMSMTPDSFRHPCRKVRLPRFDNRVENPLTPEDFQKLESLLKSWPNQHTARVILFALYTGRRKGEILKLEWTEVAEGMVTFKAEDTKSGKRQTVPLNDKALGVLKAARKDVPRSCRWVFPTKSTRRFYIGFNRDWQILRRKARKTGVLSRHYRMHDLRHTAASRWVSNGVSIYMVQKLLGHSNIQTTMRYAHIDSGSLRDAASML